VEILTSCKKGRSKPAKVQIRGGARQFRSTEATSETRLKRLLDVDHSFQGRSPSAEKVQTFVGLGGRLNAQIN